MKNTDKKKNYDNDFYGWSLHQADLLKKGDYKNVDWENIIEEIESLGRSEKRTLQSHLKGYLMHLLKKEYQPHLYSVSWELSISNSKIEVLEVLEENPSLKPKLEEILSKAYRHARLHAAKETELPLSTFPEECPWKLKDIL